MKNSVIRSRSLNRRTAVKVLGSSLFLPFFLRERTLANSTIKHNVVTILLGGGYDASMLLPVFKAGSTSQLSELISFASHDIFEMHGIPFIHHPQILTPNHPLLTEFGHRMTICHGVSNFGLNSHGNALRVVVKGDNRQELPSMVSVYGELLGGGSKYSTIAFGPSPYHDAQTLSVQAGGLVLPRQLSALSEMLHSDFEVEGVSQSDLNEAARLFYKESRSSAGQYALALDSMPTDLRSFRQYSTEILPEAREQVGVDFQLTADDTKPYYDLNGDHAREYHDAFALAAKMLRRQTLAASFVISIGTDRRLYDTHGTPTSGYNNADQPRLLSADLSGLHLFLSQISDFLDHTTVIVQTEFGRSPDRSAEDGKSHHGENNCLIIFSPFLRPGLHGAVTADYFAAPVPYLDGSSGVLTCRAIYRGLMEALISNGSVNAPAYIQQKLLRQHLVGPVPKNLFV